MKCAARQYDNEPSALYCEECGRKLIRSCAQCGSELKPTARFCPHCGAQTGLDLPLPVEIEGELKTVTALFADLAGSTSLIEGLDPEAARALLDPALYRAQGALRLAADPGATEAAAQDFERAIALARRQQAKSWELRAVTSLARLWQTQDRCADARALLAPVYGWFSEGFDTRDLQEAQTLLAALAD